MEEKDFIDRINSMIIDDLYEEFMNCRHFADGTIEYDDKEYFKQLIRAISAVKEPESLKENVSVDLGLPSGTLWATCNVGASNPENEGYYFAWGETMPKSNYVWSTYKYGNAYNQLTKYCSDSSYGKDGYIDNIKRLNPEDDAATVNWGIDWRMPTKEEFDELINVCQWEWITVNGKSCYRVTGPNGNNLYLPTAGYYDNGNHDNAGCYGYYWLSTYNNGYPYNAYYLHLDSSDFISFSDCYRYFGHSVRPVFKNKVKNITN